MGNGVKRSYCPDPRIWEQELPGRSRVSNPEPALRPAGDRAHSLLHPSCEPVMSQSRWRGFCQGRILNSHVCVREREDPTLPRRFRLCKRGLERGEEDEWPFVARRWTSSAVLVIGPVRVLDL